MHPQLQYTPPWLLLCLALFGVDWVTLFSLTGHTTDLPCWDISLFLQLRRKPLPDHQPEPELGAPAPLGEHQAPFIRSSRGPEHPCCPGGRLVCVQVTCPSLTSPGTQQFASNHISLSAETSICTFCHFSPPPPPWLSFGRCGEDPESGGGPCFAQRSRSHTQQGEGGQYLV